jgi:hypothetical protein
VASRITRGLQVGVAVPATVRVEAGWDRTSPAWALVNRLPIADIPLGAEHADAAVGIRKRTRVSVESGGPFSCSVYPIDAGYFPSFPDPVLNRC